MPAKTSAPAPAPQPSRKLAAASSLAAALAPAMETPAPSGLTGKMGVLVDLLQRPDGATIADMMAATGWQQHSIRGALAGVLKKRGYEITSEKPGIERIYKIAPPRASKPPARKRAAAKVAG